MKYKEATQSKSTVNAYIKTYKRFYMNDPIIKEDLAKIAVPTLRVWLQKVIDKYKLNFKSYSKFSVVFNQLFKYALQVFQNFVVFFVVICKKICIPQISDVSAYSKTPEHYKECPGASIKNSFSTEFVRHSFYDVIC